MRDKNPIHYNCSIHSAYGSLLASHESRNRILMKRKLLLFSSLALPLSANPFTAKYNAPSTWLKPVLDVRTRYEMGDLDKLDTSNSLTMRARAGLQTIEHLGFSALVDGEFTRAAIDEYNGGARGAEPFDPTKTVIADPETTELNQAFLQYRGWDTVFKAGRQRIKYDNDAFVGNVIWRQNEQTYDAFSFVNQSVTGLTLSYAYVNQVNRIFGSDADAAITPSYTNVDHYEADTHLLNASYTGIKNFTFGSYLYLMDFDEIPSYDNQTLGLSAKTNAFGLALYGEFAYQEDAGVDQSMDATYFHGTITKTMGDQALTLGMEFLEAGLKTPLATLHAFNGFADVFINQRANGSHNGITDTYVSHATPIFWGMKWINTFHIMGDNEVSDGYGWEYDFVLTKKFNDHMLALAKLGYFDSNGDVLNGKAAAPDATRFTVELNYTF